MCPCLRIEFTCIIVLFLQNKNKPSFKSFQNPVLKPMWIKFFYSGNMADELKFCKSGRSSYWPWLVKLLFHWVYISPHHPVLLSQKTLSKCQDHLFGNLFVFLCPVQVTNTAVQQTWLEKGIWTRDSFRMKNYVALTATLTRPSEGLAEGKCDLEWLVVKGAGRCWPRDQLQRLQFISITSPLYIFCKKSALMASQKNWSHDMQEQRWSERQEWAVLDRRCTPRVPKVKDLPPAMGMPSAGISADITFWDCLCRWRPHSPSCQQPISNGWSIQVLHWVYNDDFD